MTSVSWAPYARTLSSRDVYALDIMGEAGRSEPTARLTCATDMAAWLDETLAGLRIERAHLVGHSLGSPREPRRFSHRSASSTFPTPDMLSP